ncbi:SUKH superfamily protein [Sinobacterium caligoides]|uniref:SUKH superfamily protein n=1 Tax=Sinobacterium caligoides TaxID=933926 RepID=A0A3N2DE01_9GAMM|nr:SMI1/KNR4 family protein [Sinobacterium caligoides]ROR98006.1 SUKH superfamily protein [Sinobacterium caligoides]
MKCCKKEYPEPEIIDRTAYFVCPECGEVQEIENYRVYSPEERLDLFEKKFALKIPAQYLNYAGTHSNHVFKLPKTAPGDSKNYFGDGFYEIGSFHGLDPNEGQSIFDSEWLSQEWELPEKLVLIEGDGHEWLALDYRRSSEEPKVIIIESEGCTYKVLASNFNAFIESLIEYESVYDTGGNVIYKEQST